MKLEELLEKLKEKYPHVKEYCGLAKQQISFALDNARWCKFKKLFDNIDFLGMWLGKIITEIPSDDAIELIDAKWKFAEEIGVDIFKVRDAIRKRKGTHDNLLRPSLGVGGYCLTKDPVLANWAMKDVFGIDDALSVAVNSVNINDTMPTHTVDLIKEEIPELRDVNIALLGVSYLEDLGDTRHSPSFTLVRMLRENWAEVVCHDTYVEFWAELETEEVYNDLGLVLKGAEVVIFAVGHSAYKSINPFFF